MCTTIYYVRGRPDIGPKAQISTVGMGIPPDRSCVAEQTFKGTNITIRAMRDITEGGEVTIAYVDVATPLLQRKTELKDRSRPGTHLIYMKMGNGNYHLIALL
jgi:hypothetical protein